MTSSATDLGFLNYKSHILNLTFFPKSTATGFNPEEEIYNEEEYKQRSYSFSVDFNKKQRYTIRLMMKFWSPKWQILGIPKLLL